MPIYGDSGVGQPGSDGRTLHLIDVASRRRSATIDFGGPTRPHDSKFAPDGFLYVTTQLTNSIDVIDPRTSKTVASIPTDQRESHMPAITRDGKRAYTSNAHARTLIVLDLVSRKPIAVIAISDYARRISLSVDDHLAFTADQTKPQLAVIDTTSNRVKAWVLQPAIAYGTAPTLDARWLLATLPSTSQIAVVEPKSMKVARTVEVAPDPQEILVRPVNRVAHVSSHVGKVTVVNVKTWQVEKSIHVGRGSDGLASATLQQCRVPAGHTNTL